MVSILSAMISRVWREKRIPLSSVRLKFYRERSEETIVALEHSQHKSLARDRG